MFACSPPPGSPGPPGGPNDNGAGWSTANPSGGARYRRRQTLAPRCVAAVCALTAPPHSAVHERRGAGRRGQLFIDTAEQSRTAACGMGAMGTAWRIATRVPASRVPMLLMGLGEEARALGQPSYALLTMVHKAPSNWRHFLQLAVVLKLAPHERSRWSKGLHLLP